MVRQHVGRVHGAQAEANAAAGTGLLFVDGTTGADTASGGCSAQAGTPSGCRRLRGGLHSRSTSASDLGQTQDLSLSMASGSSIKYHAMQGSGDLWTDEERRVYLMSLHIVDLPGEEAVLRFLNDAMAGSPLPSPWKLKRDKQGNVYFANQSADVVTWSHPLEPSLRELAGVFRVCSTLTPEMRKTCIYALHETWEQEAKKQFNKWYSIRHESGRAYYCHRDTGDTMWEHPAEVVLPAHYLKLTSIEWLLDEAYVAATCATQTINPGAAGENMRNISEITFKPEGGVPSELELVRRDLEQQLQRAIDKQRLLKRELTAAEVELRAARASNEVSRREASHAQGAQRMRRSLVAQLAALEDDGGEADRGSTQAESNMALPPDARGVLAAVQEVLAARERDMAKKLGDEALLQATLSRERDAHARLGQAHLELAAERAAERRYLQGRLRESDASNEALQEMLLKSNADLRNHTECAEEMAAQQQILEHQLKQAATSKKELQEELLKSASTIAQKNEEANDEKSKLLANSDLPCIHHALSCLQDAESAITTLEERLAQAEESSRQKEAALRAECDECARQVQNQDDTKAAAAAATPASFQEESTIEVEPPIQQEPTEKNPGLVAQQVMELPVQQETTEKNPRLIAQQALESASASAILARLLKARRKPLSEEPPLPPVETCEEGACLMLIGEESEDPCLVKAAIKEVAAVEEHDQCCMPEAAVKEAARVEHALIGSDTQELVGGLAESLERLHIEHLDNSRARAVEAKQRFVEERSLVAYARDQFAEMSLDIEKAEKSAAESAAARNDVQQQLAAAQERLKASEMAVSVEIERRTTTLQDELSKHNLRQQELQYKHESLQSKQENLSCELQDAASLRNELQQRLRSVEIDLLKAHARDVMGNDEALSAALSQRRDDEAAEASRPVLSKSAVHGRAPMTLQHQGSETCSWISQEFCKGGRAGLKDGSFISALTLPRSSRTTSDREARHARRALEDAIVLASRIQLLHAESARMQRKIGVVQGHVQALAGSRAQDDYQPSTGGYPASPGTLAAASATTTAMEALLVPASQQVQDIRLQRNLPGPSTVASTSATLEASASTYAATLELQAAAAVRARLTTAKDELLRLNASLIREVSAFTT